MLFTLPFFRSRNQLSKLRNRDFSRLDRQGHTYLDYTGGNLPPASLVRDHAKLLANNVLGNPHSVNPTSRKATELCEAARQRTLDFFNAGDDYYCIFTSNATAAIKIVGECFPWQKDSHYLLTTDNHNSIHGIREYACAAGATFSYSGLEADLRLNRLELADELDRPLSAPSLLAFPAQSNASGVKHGLGLLKSARQRGWYTLLDAAAYAPTNRLDLKALQPDFVCTSFYKIFGYPTGIGCLLIRKASFDLLRKRWFAGGTVTISSVTEPGFFLQDNHERFENGTIDYQGLPAIKLGLDYVDKIGVENICRHVAELSQELAEQLRSLRHSNGKAKLKVYGPKDRHDCGGTIIFNLLDENGKRTPFEIVEAAAARQGISLRAGCFCNPGVDEMVNDISAVELQDFYRNNDQPHYADMLALREEGRGCVRVSVGYPTIRKDLKKLLRFLDSY